MKILIVEDERDIGQTLKKVLERKGYSADYVEDGEKCLEYARINQYDCILLDLNLPKIDGIKVADNLREELNNTPIIMVTSRSQIYNKLEGFKFGADDYITKPFDLNELLARINAVIKRNSLNKNLSLKFGDFYLLPDQNRAIKFRSKKNEKKIEMSNKETALLEYLLRNKGKIVSTEEILEHVWDSEIDTFTDTVKTHIKTLRQKVDPKKRVIKTIRGKGYMIE